jgi:hypothetical protein
MKTTTFNLRKSFFLIASIAFGFYAQAQTYDLGLNLKKGEKYTQSTNSQIKINQNVNGQDINTEMTVEGTMDFMVTDIENGIFKMDASYDKMKTAVGMGGSMSATLNKMEYSSESPDSSDVFSSVLASMTGKTFQIYIDKTGEITEVQNLMNLWKESIESSDQTGQMQSQIRSQLMKSYGEKALKGNLEMATHIYPGHPVKKGEKWTTETQMSSTFKANIKTDFHLAEITKDYAIIKGNSTIKTLDNDKYVEQSGMKMNYDISGTMTSEIKVDRKSGWIIKSTIDQKMDGTVKIKSPQLPSEMEMPMSMTNHLTVTN